MSTKLLEICAGDMQSVDAAVAGGAYRIELCSALSVGGITPSKGFITQVISRYPNLLVHVLIRPREGNFVYSESEICLMIEDIQESVRLGVHGIVCGALNDEGYLNIRQMERLIKAAGALPFTFHRAFDYCADPRMTLESLISLGCPRVLTSGQQPTAENGIPLLKDLISLADKRIIVMPGSGVNVNNIERILRETGAQEIHASASTVITSKNLSGSALVDGTIVKVTDEKLVKDLLDILRRMG
jgi:copper homeostasis protein